MRYVNSNPLESRTRSEQLQSRGVVALAPLVMLVWFAYWAGLVSQACCLPPVPGAHHSSHADEHGVHHDGVVAAHEPVAPMDHGSCAQLQNAELVPASTIPLMDSTSQPLLIALLSPAAPLPAFSIPTRQTLYQQAHPPPNRYLRNRRLLI